MANILRDKSKIYMTFTVIKECKYMKLLQGDKRNYIDMSFRRYYSINYIKMFWS